MTARVPTTVLVMVSREALAMTVTTGAGEAIHHSTVVYHLTWTMIVQICLMAGFPGVARSEHGYFEGKLFPITLFANAGPRSCLIAGNSTL